MLVVKILVNPGYPGNLCTIYLNMKSLSKQTQNLINSYLRLPFPNKDVSCPYFNNRRTGLRGGLRAIIGKGTPDDIIEEAKIISLREKIDLTKLSNDELKKFLIDNNLGVDCSALVYHVLDTELKTRKMKGLNKYLKYSQIKNPLRKLLVKFRPVESTGVKVFADEINSVKIKLTDIEPGDLIIMLNTGINHDRDHILLITNVSSNINYIHSFQWTSDGKYNHGVREGQIEIIDPNKNLLEQKWLENSKIDEENETFQHARLAKHVILKRLLAIKSA